MTGWSSPYADDHRRITTVCRRLDGMALAIELAAARVATLGLDGLDRGLADPLDLLTGGSRMDQRHRSLRAVLDWSLGLLSTDEQAVIRRASVFASPFTAEAAAEVAGFAPLTTTAVPHALASLAEHHLVVVVDGPSGTCYRMLETIRQYGAELMDRDGEQDDVRARHLQLVPGDRDPAAVRWRYRRAVRRGGRRPARRAALVDRPTGVACRRTPARRAAGGAHLRAGESSVKPRSGTRRRLRWPPTRPRLPRPCTSAPPWRGAVMPATRRSGSTEPRPTRHAGPATHDAPPSSS